MSGEDALIFESFLNADAGDLSADHRLSIVLIEPRVAGNTGNIARLCVTAGADLHLVRPLGFTLTEKDLRRSAMDYWPRLKLTLHDDLSAFLSATKDRRLWLCENGRGKSIWQTDFAPGDVLVFGSETDGLPGRLLQERSEWIVNVPQVVGERCMNVSTATGIVLYEALRQTATRLIS